MSIATRSVTFLRHSKRRKKLFVSFILILTFAAATLIGKRQITQVGQANLLPKLIKLHRRGDTFRNNNNSNNNEQLELLQEEGKQQQKQKQRQIERRDWNDYRNIIRGTLSPPLGDDLDAKKTKNSLTNEEIASVKKFGFNAWLSDHLPLERPLPDYRHEGCRSKTYLAQLPKVSIIIVHYNEERSVILRTLTSLIKRTPKFLLKEILLINDKSDPKILGTNFKTFLKTQFGKRVKIVNAPQRLGLIKARNLGASKAEGEVLVFLDAHIEATDEWLPPLLKPIVENPKTCTTPIIDTINYENFEYEPATPSRGAFNWQFNYVQLPLSPGEKAKLPEPHANPVMNGGLFAIRKDFFLHLGTYDEGLEIWGAEQFELSFKIWLCGGRLLEVPCSRMGHLYRSPQHRVSYTNRTDDFIARNYKRVAEVWLDSYKDFLYENIPKLNTIDAGDLSNQKALRKDLRCKNFDWFLKTIAPDLLKNYPPIEPVDYAYGAIRTLSAPYLCLDTLNKGSREILWALKPCSPDSRHPYASQSFRLSFRKDIRDSKGSCLEVQSWDRKAPVWLWPCHSQGGNQFWYYDRQSHLLVQGDGVDGSERRCLEANLKEKRIYMGICDFAKSAMKWKIGYVNQTAMDGFYKKNI